ncbi:hypothetical protein BX600DRAFT_447627 [Xylariales sp. PMI_506]|nr:hypothetical protein BX600DRAFT_447627 [Xylariales sp. PMI_506]
MAFERPDPPNPKTTTLPSSPTHARLRRLFVTRHHIHGRGHITYTYTLDAWVYRV